MRQAQQAALTRWRSSNPGIEYRLIGTRLQYKTASGTWDNVNPLAQDNFTAIVQEEQEKAEDNRARQQARQQRGQAIGNALGSLGGGAMRLGGRFFGGVGAVGGMVLGGAGNLLSGLLGLLTRGFTMLFAGLAGVLLAGVGGVVLAFKQAADGAREFGKAALSIRAGTGLNYSAAGSLLSRGLAFGLSPSDTASTFGGMNPLLAGLRGNNYQAGNYLSSLSSEYNGYLNQGPMGALLGQSLLRARGVPDNIREIAAMNPAKVAAQERWGNNLSGRLGLNGGQIATIAEDLQLAGNKVSAIFQLLRLRLGAIIAPQLVTGLERVADFIGRNSGRITEVLERVGTALSGLFLRSLETALNYLDANKDSIGDWFNKAFDWLLYEFPPLLMRSAAGVARALAFVLEAFSTGINWLVGQVPDISNFFNSVTQGFVENIPALTDILSDLWNTLKGFVGWAKDTAKGLLPGENQSATGQILQTGGNWIRKGLRAIGIQNGDPDSGSGADNLINLAVGGLGATVAAPSLLRGLGGLAMRGIGGLFGAGASGAGGAGGAGLLASTWAALTSGAGVGAAGLGPAALVGAGGLALGTAGGYLSYKLNQITGLANPDQPFTDALATGWGRVRDTLTWNHGNYDRMLAERESAAGRSRAQRPTTSSDIEKVLSQTIGEVGPSSIAGYIARGAVGGNNLIQSGLREIQKRGPAIAGSVANGATWLRGQADGLESGANNWNDTLKRIESNTGSTAKNTKDALDAQKAANNNFGMMIDVLGISLKYAAQDNALSQVRR